mgnify:CR=1 FL=1
MRARDGSLIFVAAGSLAWVIAPCHAANGPYVEAETLTYSENFTIDSLFNNFEGDKFSPDGNSTFTHDHAAIGWRQGKWDIAAIARYDYQTEYASGAAQVLFASSNSLPIAPGDYDLSVRANHARAFGLRIGYYHQFSKTIQGSVHFSGLYADELTDGALVGHSTVSPDGDVTGQLALDYHYTADFLFDRNFAEPEGYGYAVDIAAKWSPSPRWAFDVEINDVVSQIFWQDAPRTIADVDTSTTSIGADGLLSVRPVLRGQNSFEDFEQQYDPRISIKARYAGIGNWAFSQSAFMVRDTFLTTSELAYVWDEHRSLSTLFEWETGAVGLAARYNLLEARLVTDSIDSNAARYIDVIIALNKQY